MIEKQIFLENGINEHQFLKFLFFMLIFVN